MEKLSTCGQSKKLFCFSSFQSFYIFRHRNRTSAGVSDVDDSSDQTQPLKDK